MTIADSKQGSLAGNDTQAELMLQSIVTLLLVQAVYSLASIVWIADKSMPTTAVKAEVMQDALGVNNSRD